MMETVMRYIGTLGLVGLFACDTSTTEPKNNVAPELVSLAVVPEAGITTSTELLCVATAQDSNDDPINLSFVWTDSEGSEVSTTSALELNPESTSPTEELTCNVTASDGLESVTQSVTVTVENTLPVISNVSISPLNVSVDDLLTCSFDASDADGEELAVSYSWTNNGTEVGTESTLQLNPTDFTSADTVACTVTVEDNFGGIASETVQVVIDNTAPVIGSVTITPEMAYSTDTLTCTASDIFDAEGQEVTLSYRWSINGTEQAESSDTFAGPFAVGDEVVCEVTANDGNVDGVSVQASVTIQNTVPVMDSVEISPNASVEANALLECSAVSSDVDNEGLTTTYAWTDASGAVWGTESTLQLDATMVSPDDVVNCTATVEDVHGAVASDAAQITVVNTDPVVDNAAVIYGDSSVGSMLTCEGTFSDLNDGVLAPSYVWTVNGNTVGTGNMYDIDANDVSTGDDVLCTASVTDANGGMASSSASLTVINSAPFLSGVSLSPSPVLSNSDVTCSVASSGDADGDVVEIMYNWTVGSTSFPDHGDTMSGPFEVGTNISCEAVPFDGVATGDSEAVIALVANTVSVVDSVDLDAGVVLSDGTVTATAVLSDVDTTQTLTASYEWFVNGNSVQTGSSETLDGSLFVKGDEVHVVVTPNDGVEDGSSVTSSSITIGNTAPSNVVVSVTSSDSFHNDSTLTCSATADDLDVTDNVDSLTFTYTWSTGATGETLDLAGTVNPGDTVTCDVSVTDGTDTATGSDSQGITNRAPAVDSVDLDAGVVLSDGTVTATAVLSDVDTTQTLTASYEWFVNGNSVQTGSSETLDGSLFVKGDEVHVVVTPNDGVEDGSSVTSSSITIGNTAPSNVVVSVTSSDSFHNDSTLTCSATADDLDVTDNVDSLTFTYTWSTGATGETLDLAGTVNPGDTVTCDVSVTDGTDIATGSDSQGVANRAPTVDTVTLPQDVTAETASILCDATGSDLDGETPTLTYAWTVGGAGQSETSDTLIGAFVAGDMIECTVTSADATSTGSSMTASTTVLNTDPVVDAVTLTSSVYTNDTIVADATVTDVDTAQTVTVNYQWFVNDVVVQDGASNSLDGSVHFAKTDSVYVVVTANDTFSTSAPLQSSSVTVLNSDPVIASVVLTPAVPSATVDDLTCTVTATDADGDSLLYTYQWSDGTTVQQDTFEMTDASDIYLAAGTTAGTWTCNVEVTDEAGVVKASDSISVVVAEPPTSCVDLPQGTSSFVSGTFTMDLGFTTPWKMVTSNDGSRLYVVNNIGQYVSVIDTSNDSLITTVPVGNNAKGIAISPDDSTLYVTNYSQNTVSVIDTATNTVSSTIGGATTSDGIAVSPDGTRLYVSLYAQNILKVFDTSNNSLLSTIGTGSYPSSITISPDGSRFYVPMLGYNIVSIYDGNTNANIGSANTGAFPFESVLSSDGGTLYVTNIQATTISMINTSTNASTTIQLGSGNNPHGIALSPDDNVLYVTIPSTDQVAILDVDPTSANYLSIDSMVSVGDKPHYATMSPSGEYVYISNELDNTVTALCTVAP